MKNKLKYIGFLMMLVGFAGVDGKEMILSLIIGFAGLAIIYASAKREYPHC